MRRLIRALAVAAALLLTACTAPARNGGAVDAGRDNTIGPAAAAVTIEEWGDFQCPACRNFAALDPRLDQMVREDGGTRFVFRHMAFLGPESILAAEAAECAGDQGRFWDYHDVLYRSQSGENRGAFSAANLKTFAAAIDLNQAAFDGCLDTHTYLSRVQKETQRGSQLGVNSTPTVMVNGIRVGLTAGRDPVDTIRRAVQNAKPH